MKENQWKMKSKPIQTAKPKKTHTKKEKIRTLLIIGPLDVAVGRKHGVPRLLHPPYARAWVGLFCHWLSITWVCVCARCYVKVWLRLWPNYQQPSATMNNRQQLWKWFITLKKMGYKLDYVVFQHFSTQPLLLVNELRCTRKPSQHGEHSSGRVPGTARRPCWRPRTSFFVPRLA